MSKICQVTGRKPSFGNTISHSHRKNAAAVGSQRPASTLLGAQREALGHVERERQGHQDHQQERDRVGAGRHEAAWGEGLMAKNDKRPIIKLKSTAGTGYTYVTRKNKTNTRERIELKKYDPKVRQHVIFKEER